MEPVSKAREVDSATPKTKALAQHVAVSAPIWSAGSASSSTVLKRLLNEAPRAAESALAYFGGIQVRVQAMRLGKLCLSGLGVLCGVLFVVGMGTRNRQHPESALLEDRRVGDVASGS